MNTHAAATLISDDSSLNTLEERLLTNGGMYQRTVTAAGGQPLKVTIVWTDPQGPIAPLAVDPPDPAVVSELDLRITESGNTFYPWKLDKDNPSVAATRNSENNVDNVEVVTIDNPTAGTQYTINVDHDGTLTGGSQAYSLIVSGIAAPVPQAPMADFICTTANILEGQTTTFYDESTENPTSWSWSFPGGTPSTSTLQNPTVTYDTPGQYDVSLTVNNSTGIPNTTVKSNYIKVFCSSSSSNSNHVYISEVVFGGLTNASGGSTYSDFTWPVIDANQNASYPITLSFWKDHGYHKADWRVWIDLNIDGDFDDAGELVFSVDNKPHSVNGTITVPSTTSVGVTRMRVSMRDGNGGFGPCETLTDGEVEDYSVHLQPGTPQPPVADFEGSPTTVTVGNTVDFTDLSSNNPTSWDWSFDGGTPANSTAQNPTVTYNTEGVYTVSLTATNADGSDTETKIGYITVTGAGCTPVSNDFPDDPLTNSGPVPSTTSFNFGMPGHTDVSFVVT
ncbi:MAG: PKD domain-containing protein, partial [Saprospiraceae bacterium]|nr:PKD domain-containing protein [Saprospiraceae bacterium]